MSGRIVSVDCETTGLDPDCEDVFEVAAITLDSGLEWVWRIEPRAAYVAAMHPKAAEVNRYHERTADPDWVWDEPEDVLGEVYAVLAGAHLLGAVPDFDARHLTSLYRRFGMEPPRWHYHLIDVETLAVGYLAGVRAAVEEIASVMGEVALAGTRSWALAEASTLTLPWRSDDLSRLVGVEPPSGDDRHTALADARWARDLYLHITGGTA